MPHTGHGELRSAPVGRGAQGTGRVFRPASDRVPFSLVTFSWGTRESNPPAGRDPQLAVQAARERVDNNTEAVGVRRLTPTYINYFVPVGSAAACRRF